MKLTKYNLLKIIQLEQNSSPQSFDELATYFDDVTTTDISDYLKELKKINYIKSDLTELLQVDGIILHKYSLTKCGKEFMYEYKKNQNTTYWTIAGAIAAIIGTLLAISR